MQMHDMTEQAYKNGYDKGYADGKKDALKDVRVCPFDHQAVVCDSDCDHCDYAKMGEV